jgi:hypothetical protein
LPVASAISSQVAGLERGYSRKKRRSEEEEEGERKKMKWPREKKKTDFLSLAAASGRIKTRVTFLFFCHSGLG